jgi:hypothetical protein
MSYIATIELKPGCISFSDEINSIFLSKLKTSADIDSEYDLTKIMKGIKEGKIRVKKGKLYRKETKIFKPLFFGVENTTIPVHREFHRMRGVIVMLDGENLTSQVQVGGLVNTNVPGVYSLEYSVSDKAGNVASVVRKITVVDRIAPVIVGVDAVAFAVGTAFDPLAGVSVTDNVDGVIDLAKVVVSVLDANGIVVPAVDVNTAGIYNVNYTVSDAAGNVATAVRVVTVEVPLDTKAPVISGADDKEINVGDSFDPIAGVTAVDETDGDVTANIKVTLQ